MISFSLKRSPTGWRARSANDAGAQQHKHQHTNRNAVDHEDAEVVRADEAK